MAIAPTGGDEGGGVQNGVRLVTAVAVFETLCRECVRMCVDVMYLLFGVTRTRAWMVSVEGNGAGWFETLAKVGRIHDSSGNCLISSVNNFMPYESILGLC